MSSTPSSHSRLCVNIVMTSAVGVSGREMCNGKFFSDGPTVYGEAWRKKSQYLRFFFLGGCLNSAHVEKVQFFYFMECIEAIALKSSFLLKTVNANVLYNDDVWCLTGINGGGGGGGAAASIADDFPVEDLLNLDFPEIEVQEETMA